MIFLLFRFHNEPFLFFSFINQLIVFKFDLHNLKFIEPKSIIVEQRKSFHTHSKKQPKLLLHIREIGVVKNII